MKSLSEFLDHQLEFIFTDIDDTLTSEGFLESEAYEALWDLRRSGFRIVPVTGRPAGWCEMIARFWPVDGVIGENGGLYFRYHNKKMIRHYEVSEAQRQVNSNKLNIIQEEVFGTFPQLALASDQFCRLMDLAIDFAEDVPAQPIEVARRVVGIFEKHGAQAKISSIHVNGWFGDYNKLTCCQRFFRQEFGKDLSSSEVQKICTFVGDSPNDEPMFEFFPLSFAVSNIRRFTADMKSLPTFVASSEGGGGFSEIAKKIISLSIS